MIRNPRSKKVLVQTPTTALPDKFQLVTAEVTQGIGCIGPRLRWALARATQRGVIGPNERDELEKLFATLESRMQEVSRRERRAVGVRLEQSYQHEIEPGILQEIVRKFDRTPFLPDLTIRRRLRESENELVEFVDAAVEGVKRLRYAGYLTERQHDSYRRVLLLLPTLRAELVDLLAQHGEG